MSVQLEKEFIAFAKFHKDLQAEKQLAIQQQQKQQQKQKKKQKQKSKQKHNGKLSKNDIHVKIEHDDTEPNAINDKKTNGAAGML
jgi:hypothetical protein